MKSLVSMFTAIVVVLIFLFVFDAKATAAHFETRTVAFNDGSFRLQRVLVPDAADLCGGGASLSLNPGFSYNTFGFNNPGFRSSFNSFNAFGINSPNVSGFATGFTGGFAGDDILVRNRGLFGRRTEVFVGNGAGLGGVNVIKVKKG